MRRILELAPKLKDFSGDPKIASIIEELQTIETLPEAEYVQKVELLRNKLKEITETPKYMGLKINGIVLADITYEMLIALAEIYPLNDRDPITQRSFTERDEDEVEEEIIKIATSTGQIFNLNSLIQYHNAREYRGSDLGETDQSKWLLNPINNKPFNARDVARIQAAAQLNFIPIDNLQTVKNAYEEGKKIETDHGVNFLRVERLLTFSADAGNADAAFLLSQIYFDDFSTGAEIRMGGPGWWGKKQDYALGLKYLNLAIELRSQEARFSMIAFLFEGRSELNILANVDEAMRQLEQLVNEDYLKAILAKIEILTNDRYEAQVETTNLAENEFTQFMDSGEAEENGETLDKIKIFSDNGSAGATEVLIKVYTDGSEKIGITADQERVDFYSNRLNEIKFSNGKIILSLHEKAAVLGDAESSYKLALLHFGNTDKIKGCVAPIDIEKGIRFLHLSVTQGNVDAGLLLAAIYQNHQYANDVGMNLEDIKFNIQYNAIKALESLLEGYRVADGDYDKGRCAYRIAQLYLKNENLGSPEDRLTELKKYYEIASKFKNGEAIAEYGALLLTGNSTLRLEPDPEKADKIFYQARESDCHVVMRALAKYTSNSSENISRYLYWLFKEAESNAPDFDNARSAISTLRQLLNTGNSLVYYGENGKLSFEVNKTLAEECLKLLEHRFFKLDPWASYEERERNKAFFPKKELESLMQKVYAHFNLDCPFSATFATEDESAKKVEQRANPANPGSFFTMITSSGVRRENPCMLFSGRSYRKISEAEAVDQPVHGPRSEQ